MHRAIVLADVGWYRTARLDAQSLTWSPLVKSVFWYSERMRCAASSEGHCSEISLHGAVVCVGLDREGDCNAIGPHLGVVGMKWRRARGCIEFAEEHA